MTAWVLVKRCGRVVAAVWKFARRRMPKWLAAVVAVAVATPLPFDDVLAAVVVAVVVLVPVLRSAESRRELATSVKKAWRI